VRKRTEKTKRRSKREQTRSSITLKQVAEQVGLSTTTISMVLNNSGVAENIPQETKDRIFEAVRLLNYRPNFVARSLRSQRTMSVGVLIPELSDGYSALVLEGIETHLLAAGYMYLVASHRHAERLINEYPRMLFDRCVEGLIAVDTPYLHTLPIPAVSVSNKNPSPGVVNITLNHQRAAELGLRHLVALGHRRIAFLKGQSFSSDTEVRWNAMMGAAQELGLQVSERLHAQLEGNSPSPQVGYEATRKILRTDEKFTALFAFNDISAIGAIRAIGEAGKSVPKDYSVIGFDDIYEAAYHIPSITTIRQPLGKMGMLAAETLLKMISCAGTNVAEAIEVEPELIERESTGPADA
jgi:DNA-binding LacI/PurR family transcriptional regulator